MWQPKGGASPRRTDWQAENVAAPVCEACGSRAPEDPAILRCEGCVARNPGSCATYWGSPDILAYGEDVPLTPEELLS